MLKWTSIQLIEESKMSEILKKNLDWICCCKEFFVRVKPTPTIFINLNCKNVNYYNSDNTN